VPQTTKPPQHSRTALLLCTTLLVGTLAGCTSEAATRATSAEPVAGTADTTQVAAAVAGTAVSAASAISLAALEGPRLRPDVLVTVRRPLSPKEVHDVAILAPGAVAYTSGTVRLAGKAVKVASVSPANFRRFTAAGTAESTAVWQTVADGGLIASHALAKRFKLGLGKDLQVAGKVPVTLRLGALATTGIPGTDLVVDAATGRKLGLTGATALVLNAGKADPADLASRVRKIAGAAAEVDLLTAPATNPVAFLTGSRAARAFGAFSYKYFADGTIQPDAAWVRANIVSATVPIFGRITCHRLMIPQLRGALQDVVDAGLASSLRTYNGCYVPRFIERDPSHAISLHTWGIAIDLDAATNYRGIKGTMDPHVVQIFKRWGFRWGGDWKYTDPMHFEIGALLTSPRG
jgi:hypothetical protein